MEFGIGQDRRARDLVEGDVLRGQIGRRRDHQRIANALRVADRPGKRLHAAEAAAHDRGEALDAEIIGEPRLRIDPILDGDDGKVRAPGHTSRRIDRCGAGRTEEVEEGVLVVSAGRDDVLRRPRAHQAVAAVARGEAHQEVLVVPRVLVGVQSVTSVSAAQREGAVGQMPSLGADLVVHRDEG